MDRETRLSLRESIHRVVSIIPITGCWMWMQHIDSEGYGQDNTSKVDGPRRKVKAHREVYEAFLGPIPTGMQLDHLCRHPWCVNPSHLDPVTPRENQMRGVAPTILAHIAGLCLRGHIMSAENTVPIAGGRRTCRACKNAAARRRRVEARTNNALTAKPTPIACP